MNINKDSFIKTDFGQYLELPIGVEIDELKDALQFSYDQGWSRVQFNIGESYFKVRPDMFEGTKVPSHIILFDRNAGCAVYGPWTEETYTKHWEDGRLRLYPGRDTICEPYTDFESAACLIVADLSQRLAGPQHTM